MPITIKGARVDQVTLAIDNEEGGFRISEAAYWLISSADKVLARQNVGGYNGIKLEPSAETKKLLDQFMLSYKEDVKTALGLEE